MRTIDLLVAGLMRGAAIAVLHSVLLVAGCEAPVRTTDQSTGGSSAVRDSKADGDASAHANAQRDDEQPIVRDARRPNDPRKAPTTQATTRSAAKAADSGDDTPAPVDDEKQPRYLSVTRRFDLARPHRVNATTQGDRRLIIETENVQRMKFSRSDIPLRSDRSIILQLDGQPIEWLVGSEVTEFERTVNGAWVALPPPSKR